MQTNKKLTILISVLVVIFVFIIIAIIYEYVQLNLLTQELQDKRQNAQNYIVLIEEVNKQIEEVESDEYIEKWARSELGWVKENETKIKY